MTVLAQAASEKNVAEAPPRVTVAVEATLDGFELRSSLSMPTTAEQTPATTEVCAAVVLAMALAPLQGRDALQQEPY